jgi:SPP1 family predicted phage head-tail adaptor
MRAGELNRRITFQHKTITYDTYHQPIETWANLMTVWAGVITTGGREYYAAQKLNAETSAVFKIRYTTRIDTLMRIVWGDRTFEIIGINDVDAGHEAMLVSAREVV